ncbi:MAG: AAA family ATPase [Candidatus Aenigmarchaeota archaeon]|nr:AAA family ATPase [Candidatus Aenigmarchaeota archaeon]
MKPMLVILTAYPGAGKTTISRYMQTLGFARVGTDDYRRMLFDQEYPDIIAGQDAERKEGAVFSMLNGDKIELLANNWDVIVDSTASTHELRRYLLDTRTRRGEIPADKYVMHIMTRDEELIARGRGDAIETWNKSWQEPSSLLYGCPVLRYYNNTPCERQDAFGDISERFKRKLWVPSH